jgi:hypothetical protein
LRFLLDRGAKRPWPCDTWTSAARCRSLDTRLLAAQLRWPTRVQMPSAVPAASRRGRSEPCEDLRRPECGPSRPISQSIARRSRSRATRSRRVRAGCRGDQWSATHGAARASRTRRRALSAEAGTGLGGRAYGGAADRNSGGDAGHTAQWRAVGPGAARTATFRAQTGRRPAGDQDPQAHKPVWRAPNAPGRHHGSEPAVDGSVGARTARGVATREAPRTSSQHLFAALLERATLARALPAHRSMPEWPRASSLS